MNNIQKTDLTGFLLINKPENRSSYDCIRYIKKILKQKTKIGHTGTLDNFATGLLIICIGKQATKLSNFLLNANKEYLVTAKLGELTDTLDCTGSILEKNILPNLTKNDLLNASQQLGKSYFQIPPIYSALKYKGQPLYQLARTGNLKEEKLNEIIQQKKREVFIHKIEILKFESPFFEFKTLVSKGTYIRSLANDIAQQLNLYATTYKLERTKISNLDLKNALKLDTIKTLEDIKNNLISIENFKQNIQNKGFCYD